MEQQAAQGILASAEPTVVSGEEFGGPYRATVDLRPEYRDGSSWSHPERAVGASAGLGESFLMGECC